VTDADRVSHVSTLEPFDICYAYWKEDHRGTSRNCIDCLYKSLLRWMYRYRGQMRECRLASPLCERDRTGRLPSQSEPDESDMFFSLLSSETTRCFLTPALLSDASGSDDVGRQYFESPHPPIFVREREICGGGQPPSSTHMRWRAYWSRGTVTRAGRTYRGRHARTPGRSRSSAARARPPAGACTRSSRAHARAPCSPASRAAAPHGS
jgi:hypothetical protein